MHVRVAHIGLAGLGVAEQQGEDADCEGYWLSMCTWRLLKGCGG